MPRKRSTDPKSSTNRGYGAKHQALRRQWAAHVKTGTVACARCHRLIAPDALWDLDHRDDRTGYLGPSCRSCNRRVAAHKTNAIRRARSSTRTRKVTEVTTVRW